MGWIPFYTKKEKFKEDAFSFSCRDCGRRSYVFILNNREYTEVSCHNCQKTFNLILGNDGVVYEKEDLECSEENGN